MKKVNKKAVFGIGAGVLAAVIGACCIFKKKNDGEYVDGDECYDNEYAVDVEDAETEE